jgi:hypothetical protein
MGTRQRIIACVLFSLPTLAQAQPLGVDPVPSTHSAPSDTSAFRSRAKALLVFGDVAAARLFLKRASDMGDKQAADELAALPPTQSGFSFVPNKTPVPTVNKAPRARGDVPDITGSIRPPKRVQSRNAQR